MQLNRYQIYGYCLLSLLLSVVFGFDCKGLCRYGCSVGFGWRFVGLQSSLCAMVGLGLGSMCRAWISWGLFSLVRVGIPGFIDYPF